MNSSSPHSNGEVSASSSIMPECSGSPNGASPPISRNRHGLLDSNGIFEAWSGLHASADRVRQCDESPRPAWRSFQRSRRRSFHYSRRHAPLGVARGVNDTAVVAQGHRLDQHMGPGNANPSYTYINPDNGSGNYANIGYFLWIKGASGYPWDVKTWDTNYIYDRSTELVWTDPTSFKRFNQDLPISPRCITKKKAGPKSCLISDCIVA